MHLLLRGAGVCAHGPDEATSLLLKNQLTPCAEMLTGRREGNFLNLIGAFQHEQTHDDQNRTGQRNSSGGRARCARTNHVTRQQLAAVHWRKRIFANTQRGKPPRYVAEYHRHDGQLRHRRLWNGWLRHGQLWHDWRNGLHGLIVGQHDWHVFRIVDWQPG